MTLLICAFLVSVLSLIILTVKKSPLLFFFVGQLLLLVHFYNKYSSVKILFGEDVIRKGMLFLILGSILLVISYLVSQVVILSKINIQEIKKYITINNLSFLPPFFELLSLVNFLLLLKFGVLAKSKGAWGKEVIYPVWYSLSYFIYLLSLVNFAKLVICKKIMGSVLSFILLIVVTSVYGTRTMVVVPYVIVILCYYQSLVDGVKNRKIFSVALIAVSSFIFSYGVHALVRALRTHYFGKISFIVKTVFSIDFWQFVFIDRGITFVHNLIFLLIILLILMVCIIYRGKVDVFLNLKGFVCSVFICFLVYLSLLPTGSCVERRQEYNAPGGGFSSMLSSSLQAEKSHGESLIVNYYLYLIKHDHKYSPYKEFSTVKRVLLFFIPTSLSFNLKPGNMIYEYARSYYNDGYLNGDPSEEFYRNGIEKNAAIKYSIHPLFWGDLFANSGTYGFIFLAIFFGLIFAFIDSIILVLSSDEWWLVLSGISGLSYLVVSRGSIYIGLTYTLFSFLIYLGLCGFVKVFNK